MQSTLLELMQIPFPCIYRYQFRVCVCNQAGGCTAHVIPAWDCDGTNAHYMNHPDGPLQSLQVM